MKHVALTSLLLAVVSGCYPISGTLEVRETLTLTKKNGDRTLLVPGTYSATVEEKAESIKLVAETADGKKIKATLALPEGQELPENGDFFLEAEKIHQKWDLAGTVRTEVEESEQIRDIESCTYTDRQYVCRRDPRTGERICQWETIQRRGRQQVIYHFRTVSTWLDSTMLQPTTEHILATFDGDRVLRSKIYDYRGNCH